MRQKGVGFAPIVGVMLLMIVAFSLVSVGMITIEDETKGMENEAAVVFEDNDNGIIVKPVSTGEYSRIFVESGGDVTMDSEFDDQSEDVDFDLDAHLYYSGSSSSVVVTEVSEGDRLTVIGVGGDSPEVIQTYEV